MDILERLNAMLKARDWTRYRLSKESGLTESTLANIFQRNAMPSLDTLERICAGFGITLSQFLSNQGRSISSFFLIFLPITTMQNGIDHYKIQHSPYNISTRLTGRVIFSPGGDSCEKPAKTERRGAVAE